MTDILHGVLVSVDAHSGSIRRYVTDGELLLTHDATTGEPTTFTAEFVENFRLRPPERFRVGGPSNQPPPIDGGTPVAARVAA